MIRYPRVSELSILDLSKKETADCSRLGLVIGGAFLMLGQFLTMLGEVKGHFCEIVNFPTLQVYVLLTGNGSDIRLSPACFSFDFEQNDSSLCLLDRIFAPYNIP